ncbi:MAG TPA: hypothetical protein VE944_19870 [Nostoc sp.]|uniref:hypothetical protein n=1 Tax=Nostoc sp. TaxID=1180 RepID=UPI002D24488E|nr:hypothetical protein [Nostoc sp.]HYX16579.1 hypothetical protein [Nostoc sp.]
MFASAGNVKIRPSKDATNFWGRVDTYLRLDDTEKQVFQAAISTMGLDEQEEIMEIVTSWQQEGAQKTREEIAATPT